MTIVPGVRLGPYEIVAPLGAGGMGEVYRARDTRLGRSVALKILSPDIAASPDARARFEREARTVSQLSHPHVCQLHDVGTEDGQAFLVMELLEGETLAARLIRGPLPLDATLRYATQMADALDAAHRAGIVHRDLKPGNVMLPKSGLKLLDFGLAKENASVSDATLAVTSPLTAAGAVAGTVQYMAPEQLEGRGADHRSDIWALGAVIYEMATGERLFRSTSRVISPPALDRIVRTCLADDPEDRWQSARDIVLQLRAVATTPALDVALAGRAWWPWAVAAAAVVVATVSVARLAMAPARTETLAVRFSVAPPSGNAFWDNLETVPVAMAPDGSRFGFIASDGREQRVWIRSLSEIDATPLAGTEGARSLFWSPDGRSVGVFANGKLKRIDLPNSSPVVLCDVPNGIGVDGAWGVSDIVFATVMGDAVYRVPSSGGTPVIDRPADTAKHERKTGFPSFLSDGRRYVYSVRLENDDGAVMLAEPGRPTRQLMSGVTNAQFVEPDYLVYAHEGTLVAQRFDAERAVMIGAPLSIADPVRYFYSTGVARFGASRSGAVVYHSRFDAERLVWFDRSGHESGEVASGLFITLRISPDGGRVAFSRAAPRIGTFDLWVVDMARREQRLTSNPQSEVNPVWSPDGAALFFAGGVGAPHIIRKTLANGQERELGVAGALQYPEDISADGKTLMFVERTPSFDIFTASADRLDKPSPLIKTTFNEYQSRFSPDGRLFAFVSNESGRNEVYVSTYPPTGLKTPASVVGGTVPRWSRDGKELFFLAPDRRLMAVSVQASPSVALGEPSPLFALAGRRIWKDYDVAPDGKRFLAIVTDLLGDEQPLTVVTNWRPEESR